MAGDEGPLPPAARGDRGTPQTTTTTEPQSLLQCLLMDNPFTESHRKKCSESSAQWQTLCEQGHCMAGWFDPNSERIVMSEHLVCHTNQSQQKL